MPGLQISQMGNWHSTAEPLVWQRQEKHQSGVAATVGRVGGCVDRGKQTLHAVSGSSPRNNHRLADITIPQQ